MYRNLFALTLDEAVSFDDSTWHEVEEQLLGGASFDFLVPAREVIEKLNSGANELWRSDNRGKPREKELRRRLKQLREARNEAKGRLKDIRSLEKRSLEITREIQEGQKRINEHKTQLRDCTELSPVVRCVREIKRLKENADTVLNASDGLIELEAIRRLKEEELGRIRESIEETEAQMHNLRERCSLDPESARFIELGKEIDSLAQQSAAQVQDRVRQEELSRKIAILEDSIQEKVDRVLARPLDKEIQKTVAEFSMAELRGRIQAWSDARRPLEKAEDERRFAQRELEDLQSTLENLPKIEEESALRKRLKKLQKIRSHEELIEILEEEERLAPSGFLAQHGGTIISILLILGGLAAGAAALSGLIDPAPIFAGAGLLLVLIGLAHESHRRKNSQGSGGRLRALRSACSKLRKELNLQDSAGAEEEIEALQHTINGATKRNELITAIEARKKVLRQRHNDERGEQESREGLRQDILKVLKGIPVVEIQLERPDEGLASDLDSIRSALKELRETEREIDETDRRVDRREQMAVELGKKLELEFEGLAMTLIASWAQRLRHGEAARSRVEHNAEQLSDAETLMKSRTATMERTTQELQEIDDQLMALDVESGDAHRGLQILQTAIEETKQAQTLEQSLEPGWEKKLERYEKRKAEGKPIELSTEDQVALEGELEALEQKQADLNREKGTVEQESAQLSAMPGLDHVEGEVQALNENLDRIRMQRDRLVLMAGLIREADAQYRSQHQPPVFREASRFVSAITNGRYSGLGVDGASQETQLLVLHPDEISPKPILPEISRGTREQIHLALRLAFTEYIGGDMALPLLLDELFVNWDPSRRDQGLDVLKEASENRQVFFLTCHPELARRAEERLNARVIRTQGSEA